MQGWLERQLHLIDYTVAALARRRWRNLALLLVFSVLVFILASLTLFAGALRGEAVDVLSAAPPLIVQHQLAGRHDTLDEGALQDIAALPGVRHVEGRLWGYYYDSVVKANYTFMARPADEQADGTLSIGSAVARERGLAPGNTISFRSYSGQLFSFRVAAVLPAATELLTGDLVLLSAGDFRRFFAYPASAWTDARVTADDPAAAAAGIAAALPATRQIRRADVLAIYRDLFGWRDGIGFAVLGSVLLAFLILAWDKAAGISAEERREIGILRAVGWEARDVLGIKFWEGLLIALSAFLIGFVAAWLHVFHGDALLFRGALRGWSVLYPEFHLPVRINGGEIALLFAGAVLPYVAMVLMPVWRAARIEPDTVMRA